MNSVINTQEVSNQQWKDKMGMWRGLSHYGTERPVGGRERFPAAVRKWQLSLSRFQLLLFLQFHCASFPKNINGILIFTTVPLATHFGVIFMAFLKMFFFKEINDCFHLILKVFAQPNSLFLVVLLF